MTVQLTLRGTKGAPLSYTEGDANFQALAAAADAATAAAAAAQAAAATKLTKPTGGTAGQALVLQSDGSYAPATVAGNVNLPTVISGGGV